MIFGRYKYGQVSALYNMVRDMVGPGSLATRGEALGKATVLGILAMGVWPLINKGLQMATGDPNAKLRPFGALGIPEALYGFTTGQKNFTSLMGSLVSIAPYLQMAGKLIGEVGDDKWRNMRPQDKALKLVEDGVTSTYPGQILHNMMSKTGLKSAAGMPFGVSFAAPYTPTAKAQKFETSMSNSAARHDPFISWFDSLMGSPAPGGQGRQTNPALNAAEKAAGVPEAGKGDALKNAEKEQKQEVVTPARPRTPEPRRTRRER
jgi:hypothetical protein